MRKKNQNLRYLHELTEISIHNQINSILSASHRRSNMTSNIITVGADELHIVAVIDAAGDPAADTRK